MVKRFLSDSDFAFAELQTAEGLSRLDTAFLAFIPAELKSQVLLYRANGLRVSSHDLSLWLIELAGFIESFIAQLFSIKTEVDLLQKQIQAENPVFAFKKHFVLREAKRQLKNLANLPAFSEVDTWIQHHIFSVASSDVELQMAIFAMQALSDNNEKAITFIIHWCTHILANPKLQDKVKDWVSFHLPAALDYNQLVPLERIQEDAFKRLQVNPKTFRQRDGFHLTDSRMSRREALDEIHYCVYCHKNDGDFCSKGFPLKPKQPELGFKTNPLDTVLTGCPLEEKISEMHVLKRDGLNIAALAMIMLDNPMCPATGHRICNDCMKACIYQKQEPVNIPQAETRVLTDVLNLPWGVEIYDLLAKWNPLRQTDYVMQPYTGHKVLVMGLGPSGFTMAHYLTMSGCAVLGADGLDIKPLPSEWIENPIFSFKSLEEDLADRTVLGFGGVAEYGITVRWDKNFLKLIYLTLMRRHYFQVVGNVRFGGTLRVEDVWRLGFHHLTLAVGAGLPRELPIPGSLAPGMRQANDFLMALQLTGAAQKNSLANLQLRLPVVVIGGGLTGVDAATEAAAYYIVQVEKVLDRYEKLSQLLGEARVRQNFSPVDLMILEEMLHHAHRVREERLTATRENRQPDFIGLIRRFGGVTIAYRKSIQESPAYRANHEELNKALEEGIYYAEGLLPEAVLLDEFGHVKGLCCKVKYQDENKEWHYGDNEQILFARTILVATGAKPNIAYEYEHRGTFKRSGHRAYVTYQDQDGILKECSDEGHCKIENIGPFTSYEENHKRVSFIGDTHPVFHGNVVKAIAAAKRIYPAVLKVLSREKIEKNAAESFKKIKEKFASSVLSVKRLTPDILELIVEAPIAAERFSPAQFYRLQTSESEGLACIAAPVSNQPDQLSFIIRETGVSSRLLAQLKPGQSLSVMGPTGAHCHVDVKEAGQSILLLGDWLAIVYLRSIGPALKAAGYRITLAVDLPSKEAIFCREDIEQLADTVIWNIQQEDILSTLQQYITTEAVTFNRVYVLGKACFLKRVKHARTHVLRHAFHPETKWIASVHGPMQCMLKGVCAQCLQWQIDPESGKRTKAVYACSWQDQPMDMIDIDNIEERLSQNHMQETLSNLWLDYLSSK